MSKLKAKLDQAIAGDLGIELSSDSITLKEIVEQPDQVDSLVFAYDIGENIYYDCVPVWRYINGMRIKIPKFHSRPIIEARLVNKVYKRYYVIFGGILTRLKISKPNDLKTLLPITVGENGLYRSSIVTPDLIMGLRKKPLLYHRQRPKYELQTGFL